MKIGIIYICTGDYRRLAERCLPTYSKFIAPNVHKTYFVFTDNSIESLETLINDEYNKVIWVPKKCEGWPYDTLYRFKWINEIEEKIKNEEISDLFFFNANLMCVKEIDKDELTTDDGILPTIHPCYYSKTSNLFPCDRNKDSTAYIPYGEGERYYQGCLYGGEVDTFLMMSRELDKNITEDEKRGYIALWHDESHLNHYLWKNPPTRTLHCGYIYPEGCNVPFEMKMIQLNKQAYGIKRKR